MLRTELQRARWRREKEHLRLADPGNDAFCSDIFGFETNPYVRLLILPSDPEAQIVEFDAEFWSLANEVSDPVSGGRADWGQAMPGFRAAMRAKTYGKDYSRYLAVFRSGAVEMALGREAAWEENGKTWFRLVTLVGRSWGAFDAFATIAARYGLSGPFQVTLGVQGCLGASLSQVAAGWNQCWDYPTCQESQICHILELPEWGPGSARDLAYLAGDRIEQSFGSTDRRFVSREGPETGQFASSAYRW